MELDLVHDIQTAYRQILDSMSRPGAIVNIRPQADKVDLKIGCFNSTLILILMLLDGEVTFKVCSERETEVAQLIHQLTYAKTAPMDQADFILILHDAGPEDMEKALQEANPGNLINPHTGATIIAETCYLSVSGNLSLTGPGITAENQVDVQTIFVNNWVERRAEKNVEYPLGVDLIFTDWDHNILCLPRTTQIKMRVAG